jgi:hypothetical protein
MQDNMPTDVQDLMKQAVEVQKMHMHPIQI